MRITKSHFELFGKRKLFHLTRVKGASFFLPKLSVCLTGSLGPYRVPDVAIEVVISCEQESSRLAECDWGDAADDVVVAVHGQLLVRSDVEQAACGVVRASCERVAIGEELEWKYCKNNKINFRRGLFRTEKGPGSSTKNYYIGNLPHLARAIEQGAFCSAESIENGGLFPLPRKEEKKRLMRKF